MRTKVGLVFSAVMLSCLLAYVLGHHVLSQESTENTLASRAVRELWSADGPRRESAREELLRLGARAIPQLVALLDDIQSHAVPRYETGKEKEGAEALKLLDKQPLDQSNVKDYFLKRQSLDISYRLKKDCVELLGSLKAEQAVPLLIKEFLPGISGTYGGEPTTSEMQALVEIGTSAVPQLLEYLQSLEYYVPSVFSARDASDTRRPERIKSTMQIVQARVAMVLGRIGDARALPALEELLRKAGDDGYAARYAGEALERIKQKSRQ